ncbi:MAG: sigma-70 family RNA polymerase sigma factor [Candidatus Doudnabacteria bacterium]|nr:sigma-70 family RNA polymerase sigma factor [Candidatus Doudnabacteria bacterium]
MGTENVYNIRKQTKVPARSLETGVFKLAQKGDTDALGQIYDEYFERIFRFIYFRTSHTETAEDLTEEVFIKAFRSLSRMDGGAEKLQAWLFQIARNAVIDHYRSKKPTTDIAEVEQELSYTSSIVDELSLETEQKALLGAVDKLPFDQAQVIRLRFLEELDISEIAVQLNRSEGNIRIIQFRALKRLRSILTPPT